MVGKRISLISNSKEEFYKAAPEYNDALKRSGYQKEIKYWPQVIDKEKEKTKSKRKDSFEKRVRSSKTFHLKLIGRNCQNELRAIRLCLYRQRE